VPRRHNLAPGPTADVLRQSPHSTSAARGPTAFFSLLRAPGTRIHSQHRTSPTRATVHLPLIVLRAAAFASAAKRANGSRQAWVVDDTLEHEAWNLSDVPARGAHLHIWNPFLTSRRARPGSCLPTELSARTNGRKPRRTPCDARGGQGPAPPLFAVAFAGGHRRGCAQSGAASDHRAGYSPACLRRHRFRRRPASLI